MATANAAGLYRPRRPERTVLYRVLAQHFERFVQLYDERFAPTHGPLTRGAQEAVYRYLDRGIFANGFARVRCGACGHDYFVAFSCKLRCICPSCHTKRELIWAQWAAEELLEDVPHRQVVFTIPKRLRVYFRYDHTLMGDLAGCAWRALRLWVLERLSLDQDSGEVLYRTRPSRAAHPEGPVARWDVYELIGRVLDHLPPPRHQLVRYWGYYSNVSRGKRRRDAAQRPVAALETTGVGSTAGIPTTLPVADDEPFRRRAPSRWRIPRRFRTSCCTPENLSNRCAPSPDLCEHLASKRFAPTRFALRSPDPAKQLRFRARDSFLPLPSHDSTPLQAPEVLSSANSEKGNSYPCYPCHVRQKRMWRWLPLLSWRSRRYMEFTEWFEDCLVTASCADHVRGSWSEEESAAL